MTPSNKFNVLCHVNITAGEKGDTVMGESSVGGSTTMTSSKGDTSTTGVSQSEDSSTAKA